MGTQLPNQSPELDDSETIRSRNSIVGKREDHPSYLKSSSRHPFFLNPQFLLSKYWRKALKNMITYLPDSHFLRGVALAPRFRKWKKKYGPPLVPEFNDRFGLFNHIIQTHCESRLVFLEFGCASGNVTKYWAENCDDPDARFVGFDTFTGLPEKWEALTWTVDAGTWDLGGKMPVVDDSRVSFVKGTFQESLPRFIQSGMDLSSFDQKVIAIDGDLYSSAMLPLCRLVDQLDNAIVIFDEFDCVLDEFRALEDFCKIFYVTYDVLGVTQWCDQVAVRLHLPTDSSASA